MSFDFKTGEIVANMYSKSDNKKVGSLYYKSEEELPENHENLTTFRVSDEDKYLFPLINDYKNGQTDRVYVTGETGCGKSTFIKQYVKKWMKQYPKGNILLFSSKVEDKQLDSIEKIHRVKIDAEILVNPFTLNEIVSQGKPVLTIFDDIEDFPSKKITQEIGRLRDEILRNGRSYGIYCIYVNHSPTDYIRTKTAIFEANKVVIFPKRCGAGAYQYFLEKKLNIPKEKIVMINKMKSNWVCINKHIPQTIISDRYALLM